MDENKPVKIHPQRTHGSRVCIDDVCEKLDETEAEVERLNASVKHWQDQCINFQHAWESSQALLNATQIKVSDTPQITPQTETKVCGEHELNERFDKQMEAEAEVERLKVINADMRNFLSKAIHNEGFNEEQALKFIYQ